MEREMKVFVALAPNCDQNDGAACKSRPIDVAGHICAPCCLSKCPKVNAQYEEVSGE